MLTYQLLKNHAGLLLVGDYQTLKALHEVIHTVNERSPLIDNKEGPFLGLAYDLRKAYEGQRRKLKSPEGYPEIGPRFGVEILWPVLLWQCRVFRESLAFIDATKNMQAHAYALEAVIEEALQDDFGGDVGAQVRAEWGRMEANPSPPEEVLMSRGGAFCSWSRAERKIRIVGMIASFSYLYPALYSVWQRNGVKNLISPEDYAGWHGTEWPDPRW